MWSLGPLLTAPKLSGGSGLNAVQRSMTLVVSFPVLVCSSRIALITASKPRSAYFCFARANLRMVAILRSVCLSLSVSVCLSVSPSLCQATHISACDIRTKGWDCSGFLKIIFCSQAASRTSECARRWRCNSAAPG